MPPMLEYFQSGQRGKQSPTVYQGAMGLDRVVVMVVVVVVVGAIVVTSVRNTMMSARGVHKAYWLVYTVRKLTVGDQ